MKKLIPLFIIGLIVSGCGTTKAPTKSVTYKQFYEEKPLTILALPPINRSTKVEAKELFYSSLSVPLTQKGYYVMPPLLTMEILKEESAYDAEMFVNTSMKKVGELFGADAVLFTYIHEWSKTTIASQIRVKIEYVLKSTKTDEVIFNRVGDLTMDLSASTGTSLLNLAVSMLATALTPEIVVGRNCNMYTLGDIPAGKYSAQYDSDGDTPSQPKEIKTLITNAY